jgi:hypothetical protein
MRDIRDDGDIPTLSRWVGVYLLMLALVFFGIWTMMP